METNTLIESAWNDLMKDDFEDLSQEELAMIQDCFYRGIAFMAAMIIEGANLNVGEDNIVNMAKKIEFEIYESCKDNDSSCQIN